jgi:type IX secretion system PorP/SprF family membrane protein
MKRPLPTKITLFVLLLLVSLTAFGQNPPVFSQFFANPYQFNPSYAAHRGYAEANLFYRRQWLDINNTPTVGALNIQAPVGRNVSLGLTAYSDKTILLNTTSVLATFGYRIRFTQNHNLNFGISTGAGFNSFDFAALEDTNDPALAGVTQNNTFITGQFGFNYQFKNFNIGFSLPKLFDSRPNSTKEFDDVKFSKFDNRFGSVSYTFDLGSVKVSPYVIYRSLDRSQDQWEGLLHISIKDVIWVGGSYRDGYGVTGFIGLNIKSLLRIGYAYERPTGDISSVAGNTHEIYLGARLGHRNREDEIFAQKEHDDSLKAVANANKLKADTTTNKKIYTDVAEQNNKPTNTTAQQEQPAAIVHNAPPANTTPDITEKTDKTPPAQTEVTPAEKQQTERAAPPEAEIAEEHAPGHYLVLGVYQHPENARKQLSTLRTKGLTPSILFQADKNYYYVYIYYSLNRQEVIDEWKRIRQQNQYFGAWIYTAVSK